MARCGERSPDRVQAAQDRSALAQRQPIRRLLGINLGGAKSDRTCVTVIDHYPQQDKSFVIDIFAAIGAADGLTADQVLLELITELSGKESRDPHGEPAPEVRAIGVDAPLTLPPCLPACESGCQGYDKCRRPEVRWMRQQYQREKQKNSKLKHFTPYSQRPVDLYFRYKHPEQNLFQDETMGANLAPQAVRMSYLKRRLGEIPLVEVWPKLALFYLQKPLKLTKRDVLEYRHLERGAHVRERILDRLAERCSLFIYERDLKKLITDTGAFDSFLCAWVAVQYELDRVVKFRSDLPLESGWVQIPEL